MTDLPAVRYRVFPSNPQAHLFEVTCTVSNPDPEGQRFALPAWAPGSYLIREFARHVVSIRAYAGRKPWSITKLAKDSWILPPTRDAVTVTLEVYAFDASVRGAYLDTSRGFFNGPSLFLRPLGREQHRCEVELMRPVGARYRRWRVATAMRRAGAPVNGFGGYRAGDYQELIDHPVEMGEFTLAGFTACGVRHEVAITGVHGADLTRLCGDLKTLCEWHIRLFREPAPMDRYVFLVNAVGEGYGGLEHRASTALLCSRDELPQPGAKEVTDGYRTFLGLCSHEYFHTWNVKRIRPAAFLDSDLSRESYTTLLWAFEGITSYYDDLALVRSGLISQQDYLEILGRNITSLLRSAGRMKQTVAEASFDAWIKYYRQDENSPNAQVSYYLKGSLIALCLDLLMRRASLERKSLDDLMRALWRQHGLTGIGVPEDGVERLAESIAGRRLRSFFEGALRSTRELPLKQLLAGVGLQLELRAADSAVDKGGKASSKPERALRRRVVLGARTVEDPLGVRLTHVLEGGSAQAAGLMPGDVLVALDTLKVGARTLEKRLAAYRPGARVAAHLFRRDELLQRNLQLQAAPPDTCWLVTSTDATARRRRENWLAKR